jgi:hypothetical protein
MRIFSQFCPAFAAFGFPAGWWLCWFIMARPWRKIALEFKRTNTVVLDTNRHLLETNDKLLSQLRKVQL